jgi:glycosyltransferase involved in cell wall biosynthesis
MTGKDLVMVMSGFPRCSETFALNEILALEERGALAAIFATKRGDFSTVQPGVEPLLDRVQVLPEGTPAQQARAMVEQLKGRAICGVHGYFAHAPAEVAALAAAQLGTAYGFSVHAKDARKIPPAVLAQRAREAACVVACNADVARELTTCGASAHLVPHGANLEKFQPHPFPALQPFRLLAVGRLVEKKGFSVLLQAATRFEFPFQLRIVGEGPQYGQLMNMVADLDLTDQVTLCGAKTHAHLPQEYRDAHLLVVPSLIDSTGDRDGLPNVVLEAMACGRPVVGSDVGAIASAVTNLESGILLQRDGPVALAEAVSLFVRRPELLAEIGRRARQRVESDYELGKCTDRLHNILRSAYA